MGHQQILRSPQVSRDATAGLEICLNSRAKTLMCVTLCVDCTHVYNAGRQLVIRMAELVKQGRGGAVGALGWCYHISQLVNQGRPLRVSE